MLVNGRPEMIKRAIASFRAQTYERKRLLILDSAKVAQYHGTPYGEEHATTVWMPDMNGKTVGALRNAANWSASERHSPDLIAHWDSDDWSHPRRLEEQVYLLAATGKQCVGYRELLFWDTRWADRGLPHEDPSNEAWIFSHDNPTMVVGTSMMYRRGAWEASKFSETESHEDYHWWLRNAAQCIGVSALKLPTGDPGQPAVPCEPRMICSIHGANTSGAYEPSKMRPPEWKRTPEFDERCERTMML